MIGTLGPQAQLSVITFVRALMERNVMPTERRAKLLYNGGRVPNVKYDEVNANGCQPDRLSASVDTDGVHLQLRD